MKHKQWRIFLSFFIMTVMALTLQSVNVTGSRAASANTESAFVNKLPVTGVTASSSKGWLWWPELAVDGGYDSPWTAGSTSFPQWLQLDLGSSNRIMTVRTFWFNPSRSTYTYDIQISTDGSTWKTVVRNKKSSDGPYTDNLFVPTQARYVKINVTGSTYNAASLNEVEVYEGIPLPFTGLPAARATDFLDSLGVLTHFGQHSPHYNTSDIPRVAQALKYIGFRHVRDGDNLSLAQADLIELHRLTGVTVSLHYNGSSHCDSGQQQNPNVQLNTARQLAANGTLLAIEGPNEANNWPILYGDNTCSENDYTVLARYMRDLYRMAKSDPVLKNYPVFQTSGAGPGAQINNAGLQFLTIPPDGGGTLMPGGTQFADYANEHNYVAATRDLRENEAWNMSHPFWHGNDFGAEGGYGDPLFGEHGLTWRKHFQGYTPLQLLHLPRVTTETGWPTDPGALTEQQQGNVYLNVVLSQFKNGYKYTFFYQLMDQGLPWDNKFGLVREDWTYKPSAVYLHNLTSILADSGALSRPGTLNYSIADQPDTVHTLLLQKSNGKFELIVWSERINGNDQITVNLGSKQQLVRVYDPTVGTGPVRRLTNVSSVPLTLGASGSHVAVLDIGLGHGIRPPEAPTGLQATAASETQINLKWDASLKGTFPVAGYDIYRDGVKIASQSGTTFQDSKLVKGTSYSYTVAAFDSKGNRSEQCNPVTEMTQGVRPPEIPTGLQAMAASSSQVNLKWNVSKAGTYPLAGYDIYRNGTKIASQSGTLFLDSGLQPATTYSYTVAAFDTQGNRSEQSSPVSVTTEASGDPLISQGKLATSSSDEASSLGPQYAVDGDPSTRWGSQFSDPQWLQVDLGATYTISRVKITWTVAYGKAYQIQVSNDGTSWTDIYSTTTGDGEVDDLTVSGSGRYVRMYGTQRATPWGYSLWEFQVYGK